MKRSITSFLTLLFATLLWSQTDGLSYQAVIISDEPTEIPGVDITGAALSEAEIEIRFSIVHTSGNFDYQETQLTQTDKFGMINVIIGQGVQTSNSPLAFDQIDWDGTPKQLVVEISQNAQPFVAFSEQELLFVPYVYHRNITATGTLDVDGASTLNSDLTVTNGSSTNLTGTLNVGQSATVAGSLFVQGAQADVSGELHVDGDFTANSSSQLNGPVTIDAGLSSGDDESFDDHALKIEGTHQGIGIKVNGTYGGTKNFITFFDAVGNDHGRIEAQTQTELRNTAEYVYEETMFFYELGFSTAEGLACAAQLDFGEALLMAAQNVTLGVIFQGRVDYLNANWGVYFSSGGADYAEWIKKADLNEHLQKGNVVGIKDGKVSLTTQGADHLKVVSSNPIVLGNQPEPGMEQFSERIAFLGQVPVTVVGPCEKGDYLLPSGNNDGFAVAMKSAEVPTDRFDDILGIAWEAGIGSTVNVVNMAIGLNNNDIADRVGELEDRIDQLEAKINALADPASATEPRKSTSSKAPEAAPKQAPFSKRS